MKDRIKAIRKHFALTQERFGKRISKTTGFISTLEAGKSGLSQSTIDTVCRVFGVNAEWLKNGIGDMFPNGEEKAAVDKNEIGSRIKIIRTRNILTQQEFADKIGFHKNQVYNVENGKSIPSEEFINSVALNFDISIEWLRTGEGDIYSDNHLDDNRLDWLRKHPEIIKELRIRSGLY